MEGSPHGTLVRLMVCARYTTQMKLLKNLHAQSSSMKAQYAFGAAATITALIAIVWISTVPARFAKIAPAHDIHDEEGSTHLSDLIDQSKNQLGNVLDATTPPKGLTDALEEELGGETQEQNVQTNDTAIETNSMSALKEGSLGVTGGESTYTASSSQEAPTTEKSVTPPSETIPQPPKEFPQSPRVILIATTTNKIPN